MYNVTYTYVCHVARDFATNRGVWLLDTIHVLLSVSTVFCTFSTAVVLVWKRIFHVNVRAILVSFLLALCLYCASNGISRSVVLAREFYVRRSSTDVSCDRYLMSTAECMPLIAVEIVGFMIFTTAISLLVFERIWATIRYKTYEHSQSKFFVGATIASWFITPLISLPVHIEMFVKDTPIYHCSGITNLFMEVQGAGGELMYYAYGVTFVGVLNVIIFFILLYVNERLERQNLLSPLNVQPKQLQWNSSHSVSRRYQLWDNIRVGRLIVRMMIGYTLSFTGSCVLVVSLLHLFKRMPLVNVFLIEQTYVLSFHLFGLSLVRLCIRTSRQFEQVAKKRLPAWMYTMLLGSNRTAVVSPMTPKPANSYAGHFEMLNKMWHKGSGMENDTASP